MLPITLLLLSCKPEPNGDPRPPVETEPSSKGDTAPSTTASGHTGTSSTGSLMPPAVVLVIGDGMGPNHLIAGSYHRTGGPSGLAIQSLPVQGLVRTGSLSGITDSAAAGTTLASGVHTVDGRIAVDRHGADVELLTELARAQGWATGVVTSSQLTHATPATFTAHHPNRDEELTIAGLQIGAVDLMLGGGWSYFEGASVAGSLRTDDGLVDEMAALGIAWVRDAEDLAATPLPLMGAFAPGHLPYVLLRPVGEPTLVELTELALDKLQDDPEGMLLIVEGARIDHASHGNNIERVVHEVGELDDTVALLSDWAAEREALLVVTADHDCGGLRDVAPVAAGGVPDVAWRWGNHSNAPVLVSARGPGSDVWHGQEIDARSLHAVMAETIDGVVREPEPVLIPDGSLFDHGLVGPEQLVVSSEGDGFGRLQQLRLDADADGLAIGIDGVFPWLTHGVVVLLDVDVGAGTGITSFSGQLTDVTTPVDSLLSALRLSTPGLEVDLALVSLGGVETPYLPPLRGIRGLAPPFGTASTFGRFEAGLNYHVGSRTTPNLPAAVEDYRGFEAYIPWRVIWPEGKGAVPPGTRIGVAAVLTSVTGDRLTNQALPGWPAGTDAPVGPVPLPGFVVLAVDPNGDGIAGDAVLE